jgi:hypothetical protein
MGSIIVQSSSPPPPLTTLLLLQPAAVVATTDLHANVACCMWDGNAHVPRHCIGRGDEGGLTTSALLWAYRLIFWWGANIGNQCGTHQQSCAMLMSHCRSRVISMSHHRSGAMLMSHHQSRAMSMSHWQCGNLIAVKVFCCNCPSEKAFSEISPKFLFKRCRTSFLCFSPKKLFPGLKSLPDVFLPGI